MYGVIFNHSKEKSTPSQVKSAIQVPTKTAR